MIVIQEINKDYYFYDDFRDLLNYSLYDCESVRDTLELPPHPVWIHCSNSQFINQAVIDYKTYNRPNTRN